MTTSTPSLTPAEVEALEALRTSCESTAVIEADGTEWRDVYLDNARPASWNIHTWTAVLGSLQKKGLYRVQDGWAWGSVLLAPKEAANRCYLVLRGRSVIALITVPTDVEALHIAQDDYPDSDGVALLIHGGHYARERAGC